MIFTCITTGSSQCFTNADCTGDQVPADNRRDCCVKTNTSLSYNDGGSCTECIGIFIYRESSTVHNVIALPHPSTVHGFAQAVYNVSEEEILNIRFQLNVKGMTRFPGLLNIPGTIRSMEGGDASEYTHQCVLLFSI